MFRLACILTISLIGFTNLVAQTFTAGASQKNINPDADSLYLAGGKPNRPFIDIHDSLYVKAVYIKNNINDITLLTFDCIGLLYPQLIEIRAEIKKKLPQINAEHIVMTSTHTHAGPDVVGIWGKDFMHTGVNQKHMKKIVSQAVAAIHEAYTKKENATLVYATGEFGKDWVKNISEPDEIDRSVSVLKLQNQKNKNIATLTNFACHPTIMDDATTAASADYLWGYYSYLDKQSGGVNLFLQGAIGGWIQPEDVPSSFENAELYGTSLAKYVLDILKNAQSNSSPSITFASKLVNFPVVNQNFKLLSKAGVIERDFGETVASEIAFFSIGDCSFATHPGETVPAMSFASKKMMKNKGARFVMGLSQDALGYILKPSFFDPKNNIPHSEYLTGMSIGPETMQVILQTLRELSSN
ncbi:MAG: hypothetical protein RI991_1131 [Bacteroidota bacterium]|jgi:hypothetical protein